VHCGKTITAYMKFRVKSTSYRSEQCTVREQARRGSTVYLPAWNANEIQSAYVGRRGGSYCGCSDAMVGICSAVLRLSSESGWRNQACCSFAHQTTPLYSEAEAWGSSLAALLSGVRYLGRVAGHRLARSWVVTCIAGLGESDR
jgi:hypothetical protein